MEQSANVSRLAHFRMMGLLSLLWVADIVIVLFAAECILVEGPTVMIMFASEVSLNLHNPSEFDELTFLRLCSI